MKQDITPYNKGINAHWNGNDGSGSWATDEPSPDRTEKMAG